MKIIPTVEEEDITKTDEDNMMVNGIIKCTLAFISGFSRTHYHGHDSCPHQRILLQMQRQAIIEDYAGPPYQP